MSNFRPPPQSKPSDYSKIKLTQDELIALQIANDANIANARKQATLGIPEPLPPIDTMSPEELLADNSRQESLAQQNLKQLGFRDQEVSDILVQIRKDPQLSYTILNANFPALKSDIDKKFNIKLVTPTFFLDYLKGYVERLSRSTGIKQYSTAKNSAIDTSQELRSIIPRIDDIEYIKEEALRRNLFNPDELSRLDDLISNIPTESEYDELEMIDPVNKKIFIDGVLRELQNLPSAEQVASFVERVKSGKADRRQFYDSTRKIIDAIPKQFVRVEKPFIGKEVSVKTPYMTPQVKSVRRSVLSTPLLDMKLQDIKAFFSPDNPLTPQLINKTTGRKISSSRLSKKIGNENYIGNTNAEELYEMSGQMIDENLYEKSPLLIQSQRPDIKGEKLGFGIAKQAQFRNPIKFGKGISVEKQPSYYEFGKFVIHRPQLEQKDMLMVKYKSLGSHPRWTKAYPVSDIYRDFILDLLDNGKVNQRVYNQIDSREKQHFEALAGDAGIWTGLGLPKTHLNEDEEEIKRFEILKGEVLAGNNNAKLLTELRKLTLSLMNKNLIKKKIGIDLLMELSAM